MTDQRTDPRREMDYLLDKVGFTREEALRVLEDEDLWLLLPEQRFVFEGEEDVKQWEAAAEFADCLSEGFAQSWAINDATRQLIWDVRHRADEALQRARRRSQAERDA